MRVLVCGSSGCIGAAVVRALRWRGHCVIEAQRSPPPGADAGVVIAFDFMRETTAAQWATRLSALDVEAIVNCVGILMPSTGATFERVHSAGPIELFHGAKAAGIERIVQVSALGVGAWIGAAHEPAYLRSKRNADEALLDLGVDGAVVRPSLVYGPGSHSARLFATLASLPLISLPGRGAQRVQPIHVFELAEAIAALVDRSGSARGVYELGGASALGYRDMLAAYRMAQGGGEPIWLPLPMPLMRLGARLAELLPQQVLSRDTIALLERGSTPTRNASHVLLGRAPATLAEGLQVTPPESALDLRVRLAPPVAAALRLSLAFLWVHTALVSALLPEQSGVLDLLAKCGFAGPAGQAALWFSCALNGTLGVLTLVRPHVRLYALQAAAVIGYTLTAAINVPALTIDHCGPLAKNVLVFMCIALLWLAEAGVARRRPAQTSMLATRSALLSMKARRGSTSSPISIVKTRSASSASSSWTRRSRRTDGSIVVSQSCAGFISPRPL
jgi:uncharacterized protein YbjT (DUF2867 family)